MELNEEFHKTVGQYVKTAAKLRDLCVKYLTAILKLNDGNINWKGVNLPEYVSVPYDGGNHPEYASNVFSTVYGVFFDKKKNICLETEDCDCYYIRDVTTDGLADLVNFLDTYTETIGIK